MIQLHRFPGQHLDGGSGVIGDNHITPREDGKDDTLADIGLTDKDQLPGLFEISAVCQDSVGFLYHLAVTFPDPYTSPDSIIATGNYSEGTIRTSGKPEGKTGLLIPGKTAGAFPALNLMKRPDSKQTSATDPVVT
jgi:hypothetical protein